MRAVGGWLLPLIAIAGLKRFPRTIAREVKMNEQKYRGGA